KLVDFNFQETQNKIRKPNIIIKIDELLFEKLNKNNYWDNLLECIKNTEYFGENEEDEEESNDKNIEEYNNKNKDNKENNNHNKYDNNNKNKENEGVKNEGKENKKDEENEDQEEWNEKE
ncbi:2376_t:CDS:2, partial [Dentiscutata heterogama]